MQLSNVHIIGQRAPKEILTREGKIAGISEMGNAAPSGQSDPSGQSGPTRRQVRIRFDNAIAFPGLINSHDHLDFDLFPKLGNHIYKNYKEWGLDIHRGNKESIAAVLRIPLPLRVRWGLYKNLLNGITTVVHHGKKESVPPHLISVFQGAESLHSVSGEKGWQWKLMNPLKKGHRLAIHIGEGTDPSAHSEIDDLIKWNVLRRKLIGIHGVAMNEKQAAAFRALVWCPDSNYFLLGKTAPIDRLKHRTKIIFGTDSTISASWNIWEQLRLARKQKMMEDGELFDAITRTPAEVWGLSDRGDLAPGQSADIVVAKHTGDSWDAFYAMNPEDILLVMHKGHVRMFDRELYDQLAGGGHAMDDFFELTLGESIKFVQGDLPGLMKEIRGYHPSVDFPLTAQIAS